MTSRADMHCHSTASQLSRLGVQRSLGLPECATPPQEVYELAKRRGMDFVTITDHDTIEGALELERLPDTFVSEELTVRFAGEPQAVHVLCYGITPGDHEWLQAHAGDVEACAAYLHENGIACALAHPFFNVAAPLTRRHRRRLAELFPIWEVRNGSRAAELNMPAAVYVDTRGGTGIGGSDDHAGVDIGRTWTEVPAAATPEEFLAHMRDGHAEARGEQGSAAKWTHAAMALATRALDDAGSRRLRAPRPDPAAVLKMAERVIAEGSAARGQGRHRHRPRGRPLPARGLARRGRDRGPRPRPARAAAGRRLLPRRPLPPRPPPPRAAPAPRRRRRPRRLPGGRPRRRRERHLRGARPGRPLRALDRLPRRRRKRSCAPREDDRRRVALIADGIGSMHGVTHTIEQIRERGVPGFDVDVIGTDPGVDRRLPAATELELPFYQGMRLGVPGVPDLVEVLAEGNYDLVHVTAPGPAGIAATLLGADHRRAAAGQLPHRARHLRRAARRRDAGGGRQGGPRRLLQRPGPGPLAEPGRRRLARRARHRRRQGRPLGARGGRRALRPGEGRPRRLPG